MKTSNYDIDDVLRYADQAVQDERSEMGRFEIKYAREQFARAVATHNAYPMPAEIRQAFEIAIVEAFGLGQNGGWDVAGRWAHIERTLKATSVRVQVKAQAVETRRNRIREIYAENGWPLDRPMKVKRLAEKFGVSVGTIYADLKILFAATSSAAN